MWWLLCSWCKRWCEDYYDHDDSDDGIFDTRKFDGDAAGRHDEEFR